MMLDLNLVSTGEIALFQSTSPTSSDPQNFRTRAVADDHGSSNSSVISVSPSNTWDEELSSRRSVPRFVLETAKKEKSETLFDSTAASIVTRELFPLATTQHGGKEIGFTPLSRAATLCAASSSSGAASRWVDFSFNQSNLNRQHENSMKQQQVKKSRRGPRSRSSQYRGVTFYRRTGRWESHIWDCGKQVYLGGFDTAHAAARAYDRAAIKFRGVDADINFNLSDYDDDMKQTRNLSKEEFVQVLRRQSTGFSRGTSKYRGVTLHKCGRWEARMGQILGKKAYDKAAVKYNGRDAMTNFQPGNYEELDAEVSVDLDLKISQPLSHSPPAVATPWRSTSCPIDRHVPVTELAWQLRAPTRGAYSAASSGFSLSSAPPRR